MKIPQIKYVAFKSKRHFGIELEVNQKILPSELVKIVSRTDPDRAVIQSGYYEQDYDNDFWHVKFDRSCGDIEGSGGWEVASYKAGGFKDIENMGKVVDAMKTAGCVVNDECGFHIHAECADFKHNMMAALVAYWMKVEPIILEMLPKHRRNNKYAKPMTKKFDINPSKVYNWETFWEIVRPQRYDHPNRRVALNLCNYAQWHPERKTIELRLPEGTVESRDVKNWIRFFVHFVDYVRKKDFPGTLEVAGLYETMNIVGLHSEDPFFILSKGLRDTKIWVANRILAHSGKKKLRDEAEMFLNALETMPSNRSKVDLEPEPKMEAQKRTRQLLNEMWWRPLDRQTDTYFMDDY